MSVTPQPIWPGPRLLVPMTVDALVLGEPNIPGQIFVDLQIPYDALALAPSVTPQPFLAEPPGGPPQVGINLLWTLPFGLRSGATASDGSVAFPLLPNRWVVLRSFVPSTGPIPPVPQLTAFVLESDFVGVPPLATTLFPDPVTPGNIVWIGRRFNLSAWTGSDVTPAPFLRAVAPGNTAFTAAYQNVQNVFALHDLPDDEAVGAYTYQVCGWYSPIAGTPGFSWSSDPLLGVGPAMPDGFATVAEWTALLESLVWAVGDGSAQALSAAQAAWEVWRVAHPVAAGDVPAIQLALASQTLCHGGVWGLKWGGSGILYPQRMADIHPSTAVGNNATEALGAWLGSVLPAPAPGTPIIERLVEAFASGEIKSFTDEDAEFETVRHDAEFGTSTGGTTWVVAAQPQADPSTSQAAADQSVPLDETATALLVSLNTSQAEADRLSAVLSSLQGELYSLWYLLETDGPDSQIEAGIQLLETNVAGTEMDLLLAQDAALASRGGLVAYLAALPAPANRWVVQPAPSPRYSTPNDPVVLIAGTNLDDKLAQPGTFDDGSSALNTRFTGQTVTGLEVSFGNSTGTVTAAQVADAVSLPASVGPLPPEVFDLWLETLLLDPSTDLFLAGLFFEVAQPPLPPPTLAQLEAVAMSVSKSQTLPLNAVLDPVLDAGVLAEAAGIVGVYPERLSFLPWQQPWTPLSIDWQVQWFPTQEEAGSPLSDWRLGEIDYEWTGTSLPQSSQTFSGRTVLSARTALGLQQQIESFIATSPVFGQLPLFQQQELQNIVSTMSSWDVITQPLSDLGQMMLMRQPTIAGPISDPEVAAAVGAASLYAPLPLNSFFPIRAGHLLIQSIWITDVFGQRLPASLDKTPVVPVIAEPLRTEGVELASFLQLPPRFPQGSRLDLDLLQADDDSILSNSSDATSPVCGYLIPNLLDGSLMVFDATGMAQGQVQPLVLDTGSGIRWDAVPGSSAPLGASPEASNPGMNGHVLHLLVGLLGQGARGVGALDALLGVMDATQWLTDPQQAPEQGNLDALVGRPIAVVRASISLELQGLPAYDQSFPAAQAYATSGGQTEGFTGVDFAVRVGDLAFASNGVIGYFLDDDYSRFFAVTGYSPLPLDLRRELLRGDGREELARLAEDFPLLPPIADPFLVLDGLIPLSAGGAPRLLTMLVAPRGTISVISGVLPVVARALDPGPTTAAFANMVFSLRTGPLLTEPGAFRMPLPADIRGRWSWTQRTDVTTWTTVSPVVADDAVARIPSVPTHLDEGWLQLAGAEAPEPL